MLQENASATLSVRVLPRSSRDEIVLTQEGVLRIKLTAPAVEGKANKALVALLAKTLRVPKSKIEILSGGLAKTKILRIQGLTPDQVALRLGGK